MFEHAAQLLIGVPPFGLARPIWISLTGQYYFIPARPVQVQELVALIDWTYRWAPTYILLQFHECVKNIKRRMRYITIEDKTARKLKIYRISSEFTLPTKIFEQRLLLIVFIHDAGERVKSLSLKSLDT